MFFKKVLVSAAVILALLAPCSALAASWSDIDLSAAESAAGTPVAFGDIRVTYNDGTYSFDGSNEGAANGTLSNVCIKKDGGNSAVYVFDNLKLTGSFSVKTEEEDTFCELQLLSGVEDATSAGISLTALSDSRLNAYLYTDVSAVQALAQGSGWVQGSSYGKVSGFDLSGQRGNVLWTTDVDAADVSISSTPDRVRLSGSAMLGSADKPLEIRIMDAGVFYSQAEMREKIAFDVSEMINLSRVACRDENGLPRINATVSYTDSYGRDKTDSFPVIFPAQSSTVVSSVSSPVSVPTLEQSACAGSAMQVISLSTPILVPGSSRVTYDISLPGEDAHESYTLYLPYPAGVNKDNHQFYNIHLTHKPADDFDLTNDGPAIDSYEFTEYGIKVVVSSLGCFSVGASEIIPMGVSWRSLMRKLHDALSETQDAKVTVSESVIDELYPIDNSSIITVYAEYDRNSDTMTVYGGRLDSIHIANRWFDEPFSAISALIPAPIFLKISCCLEICISSTRTAWIITLCWKTRSAVFMTSPARLLQGLPCRAASPSLPTFCSAAALCWKTTRRSSPTTATPCMWTWTTAQSSRSPEAARSRPATAGMSIP